MEEEDWLVDSSGELEVEKSTTESSSRLAVGGVKHAAIVAGSELMRIHVELVMEIEF